MRYCACILMLGIGIITIYNNIVSDTGIPFGVRDNIQAYRVFATSNIPTLEAKYYNALAKWNFAVKESGLSEKTKKALCFDAYLTLKSIYEKAPGYREIQKNYGMISRKLGIK